MKFEMKCSQNTVILLTLVFDESFQSFFQAIALNERKRETQLWHNFNITLMTSDTRQLLVILPQSDAALKHFSDSLVINGSLTKLFLASANIRVKVKIV